MAELKICKVIFTTETIRNERIAFKMFKWICEGNRFPEWIWASVLVVVLGMRVHSVRYRVRRFYVVRGVVRVSDWSDRSRFYWHRFLHRLSGIARDAVLDRVLDRVRRSVRNCHRDRFCDHLASVTFFRAGASLQFFCG